MTGNLTFIKKTQRDWKCSLCSKNIEEGSKMIREYHNKWQQFQYCLECGKPKIIDKIKTFNECMKVDGLKGTEVYIDIKKCKEHFEDVLKTL